MRSRIQAIPVPVSLGDGYSMHTKDEWLHPLAPINVFIGPNNSGKSRFLRALYHESVAEPSFIAANPVIREAADLLVHFYSKLLPIWRDARVLQYPSLKPALDKVLELTDNFSPTKIDKPDTQLALLMPALSGAITRLDDVRNGPLRLIAKQLHHLHNPVVNVVELEAQTDALASKLASLANQLSQRYAFSKVYIPALRGLRPIGSGPDPYEQRTERDYFQTGVNRPRVPKNRWEGFQDTGHAIVTGQGLYQQVKERLLGDLAQRESIHHLQTFLSKWFFPGRDVALIPRERDDVLHMKIGNEREQPIFSLGDGLQQILIVASAVFFNREKDLLLFIEEPELFLHPGYQRILIDLLLEPSTPGSRQTFIATHSHQFLDITIDSGDVAVFRFQKEPPPVDAREATPKFVVLSSSNRDFPLLRELGVRNSSILMSNCTIWVEGITDRYYLRRYLDIVQRKRQKEFREDIHYSFVEYGGANIAHWSFLDHQDGIDVDRVCARLLLITDRDRGKEKRHQKLQSVLGERFCLLDCIEIENTLSPSVLLKIVRSYEGNNASLPSIDQDDYRDVRLGEFIEVHLLTDPSSSKRRAPSGRPYREESGTLKDKVEWAQRALGFIEGPEDLSPEATRLADRIWHFIDASN